MELKEFAKLLDGRSIGEETTKEIVQIAKDNDIVIIYGHSDDIALVEGSINDEVGSLYNGGEIAFHKGDLFQKECDDDECPHEDRIWESCKKVQADWCRNGKPAWSYETNIPHEKFNIFESLEVFCEGIVFFKKDIL